MVFFYGVSKGQYSNYEQTLLYHTKQFKKSEWYDMVVEAIKSVPTVSDSTVIDYLCSKYGFSVVESAYSVHFDSLFEHGGGIRVPTRNSYSRSRHTYMDVWNDMSCEFDYFKFLPKSFDVVRAS